MFKFLISKRSAKVKKQFFSAYNSSDFIQELFGMSEGHLLIL